MHQRGCYKFKAMISFEIRHHEYEQAKGGCIPFADRGCSDGRANRFRCCVRMRSKDGVFGNGVWRTMKRKGDLGSKAAKETTLLSFRGRWLYRAMIGCFRFAQRKDKLGVRECVGGTSLLAMLLALLLVLLVLVLLLLLLLLSVELAQLLKVPVGRELGNVRGVHGHGPVVGRHGRRG
jgi:hypothetical protein